MAYAPAGRIRPSSAVTRRPDELFSDVMQPLATLPVFFPLAGKRVIVVGGSDGAAWKVDLVAATGAQVDVYTTSPCDKLKELIAARANVALHVRAVTPSDFTGVTLAFGATFDDAEAIAARAAASCSASW